MNNDDLLKIIDNIAIYHAIELYKIPNIPLYMEQVLTFLNDELDEYKRDSKDKIYTKSMINNYVKSQVLQKPENKKYTSEHVISLLLIFYLKQILTLEDIKKLFDYTLKDSDIKQIYSLYLKYTDANFLDISSEIKKYINTIDKDCDIENDKSKMLLLVALLNAKANAYKLFSEKLIDNLNLDNEETENKNEK